MLGLLQIHFGGSGEKLKCRNGFEHKLTSISSSCKSLSSLWACKIERECRKNRSIWKFAQFDKFHQSRGNLDISQEKQTHISKVAQFAQIEIWDPQCLWWAASINFPLGGQVGQVPFPRSGESLFTLVSKLVSATNGRSWNTGTEVSFGESAV